MSKKLLLADDSITIQKVIQITFAHEDYELTITDNGDAALIKAQEIRPDLIMADVYMPGKNGYELATAIKQDSALQHVPVLLLAGSFEPFDEDKARACMADAWIEKPFESQSLIDKVAELLSAAKPAPQVAAPVAEQPPALEPAVAAEAAFDEPPLGPFDEPFDTAPEMAAAPEDPFSDISFDEEPVAAEPESPAFVDDWSDVVLEPAAEPVGEDAFAASEEPAFLERDDVGITEEQPLSADVFTPAEEARVAEPGFDDFDMDEEEIIPLGDDDILGAEDLEPLMEEQTLAAWSRAETDDEDVFAGPVEEEPAFEASIFPEPEERVSAEEPPAFAPEEPAFAEESAAIATEEPVFVEGPAAFAAEEPVFVEEAPEFEVPTEDLPAEETVAAFVTPEPAETGASIADIEVKASSLSEDEIEQIIEKVVTKVVERLAGTILEKIAWEVVPDMAENLIRQEIRKIKDAAA